MRVIAEPSSDPGQVDLLVLLLALMSWRLQVNARPIQQAAKKNGTKNTRYRTLR